MPAADIELLLPEAAAAYGVTASDLENLGAFESEVFGFTGAQGRGVLKVIAPEHRSPEQVQAELDWLVSLRAAGVPVGEPLPSRAGNHLEVVGGFTVVAFRRVEGSHARLAEIHPARARQWGRLLGLLQAHSRTYQPQGPRRRRIIESTYLTRWRIFEESDPPFAEAARRTLAAVEPQLRARGDAGLIHADLHPGNLLWSGEEPTAIDFDDCGYGDYSYDLAMALYYAIRGAQDRTPLAAAEWFVPPFVGGFREVAPWPLASAEAVAAGLDARCAELVIAMELKLTPEKRTPRLEEFRGELRDMVVSGRPLVDASDLDRIFTVALG